MRPIISVILPAYNAENYLKESIDSILCQTFSNFELIIIDDGSTDNTNSIIRSYDDKRIVLLTNEFNRGLIYSLNRGIKYASGEFIARMDADDICRNDRFDIQLKFMRENPNIGICGSSYELFGKDIKPHMRVLENNPLINYAYLMFFPVVAHPSVMMRKKVIDQFGLRYRDTFKNAEDYGLWVEASGYTEISNVKECLLHYRILNSGITQNANKDIKPRYEIHKKIYETYFERLNIVLTEDSYVIHFLISDNERFKQYNHFSKKQIHSHFKLLFSCVKSHPLSDYFYYVLNRRRLSIALIQRDAFYVGILGIAFLYSVFKIKILEVWSRVARLC